jgi:hypothetical protein
MSKVEKKKDGKKEDKGKSVDKKKEDKPKR